MRFRTFWTEDLKLANIIKHGSWLVVYLVLALVLFWLVPDWACTQTDLFLQVIRGLIYIMAVLVAVIIGYTIKNKAIATVFRRFMRLISRLKYSLLFTGLLVYLPLTACEAIPLHHFLGSLFIDLSEGTLFWIALLAWIAMWSLAFTQGLTIDTSEADFSPEDEQRISDSKIAERIRSILKWAYQFFNADIGLGQLATYSLFMLVGLGIIFNHRAEQASLWLSVGAMIVGIFIGYAIIFGVSFLISRWLMPYLMDTNDNYMPLPKRAIATAPSALATAERDATAQPKQEAPTSKKWLSWLPSAEHGMAFIIALLVLVIYIVLLIFGFRPESAQSPLPYLYVFLILLILMISGIDFWLSRIRVSFLLSLLIWVLIGYTFTETDHYYAIRPTTDLAPLSPVQVAEATAEENLVVITATGGGIWASGWTTKALQELITQRPALLKEIRLISTVSGGSLGAAYFLNDLCKAPPKMPEEFNPFLMKVHNKAISTSLSAVTYGFASWETMRFFSGGISGKFSPTTDRATFHEMRWATIANSAAGPEECRQMLGLRDKIRKGELPAPIFNTTAMESGRRVMITPITFEEPALPAENRGDTLSELLFGQTTVNPDNVEADLSLWTAARLSAAFSYVTPAARAMDETTGDILDGEPASQGYHLIDGGYYDNFGVSSALDWLEPVLQQRIVTETQTLTFKKVAIIELRAFPLRQRDCHEPAQGGISALLGPALGLYNIRTGAAHSRNEIELMRFIDAWNKRLKGEVEIRRFVLEPPPATQGETASQDQCQQDDVGALSWHLTQNQINDLDDYWAQTITQTIFSQSDPATQSALEDRSIQAALTSFLAE